MTLAPAGILRLSEVSKLATRLVHIAGAVGRLLGRDIPVVEDIVFY
jgi:hypothetical protein